MIDVTPEELAARLAAGNIRLIDVRTDEEIAEGMIPGAEHIALDRFDPQAFGPADRREVVLYCRSGKRSAMAGAKLAEATGKPVEHLAGGILAREEAGRPARIALLRFSIPPATKAGSPGACSPSVTAQVCCAARAYASCDGRSLRLLRIAAAASPNSTIIGGAGTSVPPLDDELLLPLDEDEEPLLLLDELPDEPLLPVEVPVEDGLLDEDEDEDELLVLLVMSPDVLPPLVAPPEDEDELLLEEEEEDDEELPPEPPDVVVVPGWPLVPPLVVLPPEELDEDDELELEEAMYRCANPKRFLLDPPELPSPPPEELDEDEDDEDERPERRSE